MAGRGESELDGFPERFWRLQTHEHSHCLHADILAVNAGRLTICHTTEQRRQTHATWCAENYHDVHVFTASHDSAVLSTADGETKEKTDQWRCNFPDPCCSCERLYLAVVDWTPTSRHRSPRHLPSLSPEKRRWKQRKKRRKNFSGHSKSPASQVDTSSGRKFHPQLDQIQGGKGTQLQWPLILPLPLGPFGPIGSRMPLYCGYQKYLPPCSLLFFARLCPLSGSLLSCLARHASQERGALS